MKNFIKKYLWLILLIAISFLLITISVLWMGFFVIGAFVISISFFVLAWRAKQRYESLRDFTEEDLYIDARKFDYDEDVYYIGTNSKTTKGIKKNFFSKFNAKMPMVICVIMGLAFLSFAVMSFIAMVFN